MRTEIRVCALGFALAACGGGSGTDAPPVDLDAAAEGADAGMAWDGGPAADGGASTTDGGASAPDGGPSCVPEPGDEEVALRCSSGSNQVAVILDEAGGHRVRISGPGLVGGGGCQAIDRITVRGPAGTVADFAVDGIEPVLAFDAGFAYLEGPAGPAAVAACDDEESRFDGYTLELAGRIDGGTFVTSCGAPPRGWPPPLVLTCHRGIDPARPNSETYDDDGITVQGIVVRSADYEVRSVDDTARVIASAFDGSAPPPFDSTGWHLATWGDQPIPGVSWPISGFWVEGPSGAFGSLCGTGGPDPLPSLLLRVSGTTDRGPFSTELHAQRCSLLTD